jgi:hypothetical protein
MRWQPCDGVKQAYRFALQPVHIVPGDAPHRDGRCGRRNRGRTLSSMTCPSVFVAAHDTPLIDQRAATRGHNAGGDGHAGAKSALSVPAPTSRTGSNGGSRQGAKCAARWRPPASTTESAANDATRARTLVDGSWRKRPAAAGTILHATSRSESLGGKLGAFGRPFSRLKCTPSPLPRSRSFVPAFREELYARARDSFLELFLQGRTMYSAVRRDPRIGMRFGGLPLPAPPALAVDGGTLPRELDERLPSSLPPPPPRRG